MLSIMFTLNLSNIKNDNLLQPENQSWIGTFIKLTDLNLKFASPNCSILKMKDFKRKGHKYAAIDIFWRCWDESYYAILCFCSARAASLAALALALFFLFFLPSRH